MAEPTVKYCPDCGRVREAIVWNPAAAATAPVFIPAQDLVTYEPHWPINQHWPITHTYTMCGCGSKKPAVDADDVPARLTP